MNKFPRRWSIKDKVEFLQRKIIINSILYYYRDTNFISDNQFDEISAYLVNLQSQINIEKTMYGYIFYDFDGTTGFHLYDRLTEDDKNYLDNIVTHILVLSTKSHKIKTSKKGALF